MVSVSLLDFVAAAGAAAGAVVAAGAPAGVVGCAAGCTGPVVADGAAPPPHAVINTASSTQLALRADCLRFPIDLMSLTSPRSELDLRSPRKRPPAPRSARA